MLFNQRRAGLSACRCAGSFRRRCVTARFSFSSSARAFARSSNPSAAGAETMLGKTVNALSRIDSAGGRVFIEGETWNAVSETPVEAGQPVEIIGHRRADFESETKKLKLKTMDTLINLAFKSGLGNGRHRHRRSGDFHSAAGHPHFARIRARRDFPARQIAGRERAGHDFPHSRSWTKW